LQKFSEKITDESKQKYPKIKRKFIWPMLMPFDKTQKVKNLNKRNRKKSKRNFAVSATFLPLFFATFYIFVVTHG